MIGFCSVIQRDSAADRTVARSCIETLARHRCSQSRPWGCWSPHSWMESKPVVLPVGRFWTGCSCLHPHLHTPQSYIGATIRLLSMVRSYVWSPTLVMLPDSAAVVSFVLNFDRALTAQLRSNAEQPTQTRPVIHQPTDWVRNGAVCSMGQCVTAMMTLEASLEDANQHNAKLEVAAATCSRQLSRLCNAGRTGTTR